GPASVAARGRAGRAAQYELVAHEFAVVLTQGAGGRLIAGIADVWAGGPLPGVAKHLIEGAAVARRGLGSGMKAAPLQVIPIDANASSGDFPLRLGGAPGAGPAGKCLRLVETNGA